MICRPPHYFMTSLTYENSIPRSSQHDPDQGWKIQVVSLTPLTDAEALEVARNFRATAKIKNPLKQVIRVLHFG